MNQKSLDKKKPKELKCIEDLIKTGWKVLYFKIKGDNLDVVGENGVQLLNYFEDTLTQQRTELLEEILNLECLKEEFVKERWLSGSEEIPKEVFRNQLRKEIKEEILENLKDIEIGEFEGWDLAHKFNCCPGDDMADAYNQALKDVIKLIKKL